MIELLTTDEVAELFKVKENTIRAWVCREKFPKEVLFKLPGKTACIPNIKGAFGTPKKNDRCNAGRWKINRKKGKEIFFDKSVMLIFRLTFVFFVGSGL